MRRLALSCQGVNQRSRNGHSGSRKPKTPHAASPQESRTHLTSYFESDKAPRNITIGASGPLSVSVTFPFDAERSRLWPLTRSLAAAQVFDRLWQLIRSLVVRLAVSAGLSIRSYVRTNALASAPLTAAIVIVFFTADSWKILGQGFDWQFFALLGFFSGIQSPWRCRSTQLEIAFLRFTRRPRRQDERSVHPISLCGIYYA